MAKNGSKPKRNKRYVPKGFDKNAMFHVIRDNWRASATAANETARDTELRARFSAPVGIEQQEELFAEYRTALVAMLAGGGDLNDWSMVISALNVGLVLCERGFGPEYLETFMTALDSMAAAHAHYLATGKWEWSEEANAAINDCIDVHAAQLEATIQADVLSAYAEVKKRIDASQVIIKEAA